MAQASYIVVDLPLTAIVSQSPVRNIGNAKIEFIGVLDAPVGVQMSLHFGAGGDAVPIAPAFWTGIVFEPSHDQGLYFTVPVVQAGAVKLFIGFEQPCP